MFFSVSTCCWSPRYRDDEESAGLSGHIETDHAGRGRFHLAYFRHTERWQLVYHGLTPDECFETIEQAEIFWPLT